MNDAAIVMGFRKAFAELSNNDTPLFDLEGSKFWIDRRELSNGRKTTSGLGVYVEDTMCEPDGSLTPVDSLSVLLGDYCDSDIAPVEGLPPYAITVRDLLRAAEFVCEYMDRREA
jgi:hypothetical protein